VPPLEFNEARARLAAAYYYAGNELLAEHYLKIALPEYERNAARGVRYARTAYAEGYFILGEIHFKKFAAVTLEGDATQLAAALQEKAEHFLAAREYYTLTVRTYEPTWLVAALYRVGLGYENFYTAVMAVPDPPDLSAHERPGYRQRLAEKMKPVLDKALLAYRRNLELAADYKLNNNWVDETRAHYQALSTLAQREP